MSLIERLKQKLGIAPADSGRAPIRIFLLEDDERRCASAHLDQRRVRRPGEADGHAELVRSGLDLRREHEVVEYG